MIKSPRLEYIKEDLLKELSNIKYFKQNYLRKSFEPKYPKLFLLIIVSIFTYYLFSSAYVNGIIDSMTNAGYFYSFLFGALFTFGFSTPIAIGFFVSYAPSNIFLAAIIGGIGAVIADLTIFKMIRFSFMNEFENLKNEKAFIKINRMFRLKLSDRIKLYLTFIFAGIVIASPLPDEVGVTMLAGLSRINSYTLAILSFIFNSLGIFIMLSI
jgi:hypothetical protein